MSPAKKVIAVFGATGSQGGSLIRAILALGPDSGFAVRAITRDPNTEKAKKLAALGVSVVTADITDAATLPAALEGVYGAFLVTNPDFAEPANETAHATAMAHACKNAGVKHAIWSSLEDTRKVMDLSDNRMPTLHEKYKVPHFDAKGEADEVFTSIGLPTTILLTSFFWENYIAFGMGPKKTPSGELVMTLPIGDARMAGIAVDDIGKSALAIFQRPGEFISKRLAIAGDILTGAQIAEKFSQVLGQPVAFQALDPAVYRTFGFPGAEEMGNMFQYYRDFEKEFCLPRDVAALRALVPELKSLDQWLAENKDKISIA